MVCMTLRYYSAEHKDAKMVKREVLWDHIADYKKRGREKIGIRMLFWLDLHVLRFWLQLQLWFRR